MPFFKKKTEEEEKDKEKDKKEKEKKEEKKEKKEKKEKEKKIQSNKVKPQLNPYCTKCPHYPPQSLTPKDNRKYQKEKNYKKLYKVT